MDQERETRLRSPVAGDFGWSSVPAKPSETDKTFGPGYYVGMLTGVAALVASFIATFLASNRVSELRGVGLILMCFGGTFAFGTIYTVVTNKGIPWSLNAFGRLKTGVLDRSGHPLGFWLMVALTLLISCTLIGAGAWLHQHADVLAGKSPRATSEHR